MIRGIITAVIEGAIKRFTATGRQGETISDREYMQHYGYTSRPQPGAEAIIIKEGNHIVMIASDDRRYRIALEAGEVALYTDEGDTIHLKRGREIHITAGSMVRITAPDTRIEGDVEITGTLSGADITASGTITDGGGNTNHHTHE